MHGHAIIPRPSIDDLVPLLPPGVRVLREFIDPRRDRHYLVLEGPGLPVCPEGAEIQAFAGLWEIRTYLAARAKREPS